MSIAIRSGMRMLTTLAAVLVVAAVADVAPARAGETIIIHDRSRPARAASHKHELPPYSDAAIASNAWARAWLLLDIDRTGFVTRLKMIGSPGHDLDQIAVSRAFATRFEPALDRAGQPTPSQLVLGMEWPAYWWLHDHQGSALPPCRGSGPLQLGTMSASSVYRDCSEPEVARATNATWVYPRAATTNFK